MDQTQEAGPSTHSTGPNWLAILAVIGAGIGAATPWISVSFYDAYNNLNNTVNYNGTDTVIGDGWSVLMFAGALALLELITLAPTARIGRAQGAGELLFAAAIGAIAVKYLVDLQQIGEKPNIAASAISPGGGLIAVAVGAGAVALAGCWQLLDSGIAVAHSTGPSSRALQDRHHGGSPMRPVETKPADDAGQAVAFAPDGREWLVGGGGKVRRTDDAGATWIPIDVGASADWHAVAMAGNQSVWMAGTSGTRGAILHSHDAGATWTAQESGTADAIISISAASPTDAWAVVAGGLLLHSSDGGGTWRPQHNGLWSALTAVAAIDPFHACAVDRVTWHPQDVRSAQFRAVSFTADGHGWAVGDEGATAYSMDGGQSWRRQSPPSDRHLTAVVALDAQHSWAVGIGGAVQYTRNGGKAWKWAPELAKTRAHLWGVAATADGKVIIVGDEGVVRLKPVATH